MNFHHCVQQDAHERILHVIITLLFYYPAPCTTGSIRLAGGNTADNGRVEICVGGAWGTICSNGFDNNDARVMCRQLGKAVSS